MQFKVCKKCQIEKPIDCFSKEKRVRDGLFTRCKECERARLKKYLYDNKDHVKLTLKKYSSKESAKTKKLTSQRLRRQKNREEVNAKAKTYRENNRDAFLNRYRKNSKLNATNLTDYYVKGTLSNTKKPITTETISIKREILKIKRTVKQLKNEVH